MHHALRCSHPLQRLPSLACACTLYRGRRLNTAYYRIGTPNTLYQQPLKLLFLLNVPTVPTGASVNMVATSTPRRRMGRGELSYRSDVIFGLYRCARLRMALRAALGCAKPLTTPALPHTFCQTPLACVCGGTGRRSTARRRLITLRFDTPLRTLPTRTAAHHAACSLPGARGGATACGAVTAGTPALSTQRLYYARTQHTRRALPPLPRWRLSSALLYRAVRTARELCLLLIPGAPTLAHISRDMHTAHYTTA